MMVGNGGGCRLGGGLPWRLVLACGLRNYDSGAMAAPTTTTPRIAREGRDASLVARQRRDLVSLTVPHRCLPTAC